MEGPGAILEASKRRLGGSLGRLGAVLGALEAMLEAPGGQTNPKMEPGRVPNRGPEATRTKNVNFSKTVVFQLILMIFKVLGPHFGVQNWFKMGPKSHHGR